MTHHPEMEGKDMAKYFERDGFQPNPADHYGTLDTSGTERMDHSAVSPLFPEPLTPDEEIAEVKKAVKAAEEANRKDGVDEQSLISSQDEQGNIGADVKGVSSSEISDARQPEVQVAAAANRDAHGEDVFDGPVPEDGADAPEDAQGDEYDPGAHDVNDVNAYLETADDEERERVLEAERNGKARKGILTQY